MSVSRNDLKTMWRSHSSLRIRKFHFYNSRTLVINDNHGVKCAVLLGHARQDPSLAGRVGTLMGATYPESIHGDSTVPGFRYLQSGVGAPTGVHPFKLQTKTCRRYAQRFPSMSQEGKADGSEREQILNDLKPLILEVIRALRHHLPAECDIQAKFAQRLPLHGVAPGGIFSGVVINISVATGGHRDKKDFDICVVVALGNWKGGHIVLHELGLAGTQT
ncbi:hypothetical protein PUNSTDRAFT_42475 [Punctularia strigosozonata HHB-11173 SS5]|uniref:uncharacterized protein n=1 Tax=Punctularia strigosozonata (strain HHB-11173) TaxID=741275 RepID=UPI0004416E2D|nr:uncharacterized protein PUNSTDRAFT_42475 [Punctularia strigosozonata HHB-11173 SS5]EIN13068.1 hypothetical protein PUNSTDRAFT_42475 [Punctularia strigosozonata HHB-11173 SS5]